MSTGVMIMTVTLLVLLFLKLPVFVAILGASAVYFVLTPGINPAVFAQQAITGAESVTLLAIPFFVCAGVLMNYTGVTKRIMDFCAVLTGRMYGGLSQVNILLSTLMGGLSGSALADAAMEAKMLVPEMEKKGIHTEKGDFNRWVRSANAKLRSICQKISELLAWPKEAKAELSKPQEPMMADLLGR